MTAAANSPPASGPPRLVVLLSGSGRSLANLVEKIAAGSLQASIELVVASRGDVRGVEVARAAGIPTAVISPRGVSAEGWSAEIFAACRKAMPDLVVMAGFLHLVQIPADFSGRVINIHPSLLPAFGGQGFHGLHVHRAVLARGCTVSGCTVHLVDDQYDHGRIILQRAVGVLADDTPESLAARVFAAECIALPQAIGQLTAHSRLRPTPRVFSPLPVRPLLLPIPHRSSPMHRTLGNIIADTLHLSLGYADRLLAGVPADQFARFASVGGTTVESNHPAFVYGHLCLYAPKILGQLDLPAPPVPPAFEAVFSKDAQCVDDPQGTIYPGLDEVMQAFREGYRPVVDGLRGIPDAVLERPNPATGRMAELFPTLGSVHTFYCGGHMMMHLGQLSAWRRMQGMGAA